MHDHLAAADLDGAALIPAERGLLEFVKVVTIDARSTTDDHVVGLRDLGWSDEQVAEAVYVAAMFAFVNRIADAFGIEWDGPT